MNTYYDYVRKQSTNQRQIVEMMNELRDKSREDVKIDVINETELQLTSREERIATVIRNKVDWLSLSANMTTERNKGIEALEILDNGIKDMLAGNIDLNLLCETRRLAARYKSSALDASVNPYDSREWAIPNLPAVQLARKIKARSPGQEPSIGTRFFYIKTLDFSVADTKSEQVELVQFVKDNHIPIDYAAYLTKDQKPFYKLFAILNLGRECEKMVRTHLKAFQENVNKQLLGEQTKRANKAKSTFFTNPSLSSSLATPFTKRKTVTSSSLKKENKNKQLTLKF